MPRFVTDIIPYETMIFNISHANELIANLTDVEIFNLIFFYDRVKFELSPDKEQLIQISQVIDKGRAPEATMLERANAKIFMAVLSLKFLPRNIREMCEVVVFDHRYKQLCLRWLEMDSRQLKAVANILPCTRVVSLNVSGNYIGSGGAKALETTIQLEKLYIAANNIDDEGVVALNDHPMLDYLDVRANGITDIGAKFLAINERLKTLVIELNNISIVGLKALAANPALSRLYVDSIPNLLESRDVLNERNPVTRYNTAKAVGFSAKFPSLKRQAAFFAQKRSAKDDDFKDRSDAILDDELKKFITKDRI